MPYLPPDVLDPAAYSCVLVFYPTQDEYAAALLGQIAELSDAWNWETDRASQATIRQVWLEAERQTLECWNMACLDDIIALLEDIRDHEWCCDTIDSVPGGDGIGGVDDSTLPPDVDRDGESLPPEYEGDPTAYDAYLCGQANAIADTTDDAVDAVHDTILAASNIIVFATLIVLAFGNVIGMGIAAILAGGYTLVTISEIVGYYSAFTELRELLGGGDPGGLVAQTKGELAAIHDEIVDAVFCANDASEAAAGMHALVDANVTSGPYAALLKLTYTIAVRPIFWGFGGAPDAHTCSCGVYGLQVSGDETRFIYSPFALPSVVGDPPNDYSYSAVRFYDENDDPVDVSLTSWDNGGAADFSGTSTYSVRTADSIIVWDSDTPPSLPITGWQFRINNKLANGDDRGSFVATLQWETL